MADELDHLREALAVRYRIGRQLGSGGMATVYRAHDLRHDRAVAIKVFKPAVAAALGRERFLREITVTAGLDHPHILPLLDSGEAGGFLFYVMPCVEGETLRERLRRELSLPLRDALAIARDVCDALDYAHDAGVVHRDIKPENILLAGSHARIADFGIAQADSATEGPALTQTGMVVGTTRYMSPEQARGLPLDRRSDIYSLGCVVYEMLAGHAPAREGELAPIPGSEGVPSAVEAAMRRALARNPEDRFATAANFARALDGDREGLHELPRTAPTGAPASPTATVAIRESGGRRLTARYGLAAVLLAAAFTAGYWFFGPPATARWLANRALPAVEDALNSADYEVAWAVVRDIERRIPDSPELARLWPRISWRVTLRSEPDGARVFRQGYGAPDDEWEDLGVTPLVGIRVPHGLSRLRFERQGYRPLVRALGGAHFNWAELGPGNPDALLVGPDIFRLDPEDALPSDMVRVEGWRMTIDGREVVVKDFFLDRHEVTNAAFKAFVDEGGYERKELWDPIVVRGAPVPWDEAMKLFVDGAGRPGPATWEAGTYREGEDDYPVSGVSWYEAAAFARFAARELPTAHHWQQALANAMFPWLLPASNFGGQGPRAVTSSRSMTHVGAYDMTGNVREWTSSRIGNQRIILGGSWHDPYYVAGTEDTAARPEDRTPGNGMRLALTADEPAVAARLHEPVETRTTVSVNSPPPVSDDIYAAYRRVFDYDEKPLNASVGGADRGRLWTRERIEVDAGYGTERLPINLYVPTSGSPPFQAVVYWPGWDTFALSDADEYFERLVDFLVKSGRVVAFPVFKGTFERRLPQARRPPFDSFEYRDNAIETVKDLRRAVDYLNTRSEIDREALAFVGYSWGGVNGPLALAIEPRLKVSVIVTGLLPLMPSIPEVDPVNALPRVRQPTLLLSGKFDAMVPLDNARRYFALLGTPADDKRHVLADGGHVIPRELLIRETVGWLDRHLGRPRR
jgi:formylglycine-generating enzyme required for sulfatase activity/dienelactone hydrolase